MNNNAADQPQKTMRKNSAVNRQLPVLVILFAVIVFVSIKTVIHRHESRALFVELQKLEKERDRLLAKWSRLKLEQGTKLNQVRVEQQARWSLSMQTPKSSEVKVVREPALSKPIQPVMLSTENSKVASSD